MAAAAPNAIIRQLMPRGPLPDEIQRFLAAPRTAVVGWLRDDAVTAVVERWHMFGER